MLLVKRGPSTLSSPLLRLTSPIARKGLARRRLACTSYAADSNGQPTSKDGAQVGGGHGFGVNLGEEHTAYQEELFLARRQLSSDVHITHVLDMAVQARTAVRPVSDAVAALQLTQKVSALAYKTVLKDSKLENCPSAAGSTNIQPPNSGVEAPSLDEAVSSGTDLKDEANATSQIETPSALSGTADTTVGTDAMAAQLTTALRATAAVARMLQSAADKASDIVKIGEAQPALTQVEDWQKVLDSAAETERVADAMRKTVQLGEEALEQLGKESAAAIIEKMTKKKQPPRVATEVKVAISNSAQATAIADTAVATVAKAVATVNAVASAVADVPPGSPNVAAAVRETAKATAVLRAAIEEISVLEATCKAATAMHEVMMSLLCIGRVCVPTAMEAWQHAEADAARQMKASMAAVVQAAATSASEIAAADLAMAKLISSDTKSEDQGTAGQAAKEAIMNCKTCMEAVERVMDLTRTASQAAAVWQCTGVVAAAVQGVGEAAEAAAVRVAPVAVALAAARSREAEAAVTALGQVMQAMEDAAVAMEASALAQVAGPIEAAAMPVSRTENCDVEDVGLAADATGSNDLQLPAASKDDGNGGGNACSNMGAVARVDQQSQDSTAGLASRSSRAAELAALAVVSAAEQEVRALLERHVKGPSVARGLVFEVHHAASFNLDAIRRGSGLRAERWEDGADIRIYDRIYAWATLARAQLKTARNGLGQSKYKGMQKVVAEDNKPSSQTSHVVSYGGVSSRPITAAALSNVLQDPAAHFRGLLWWQPDAQQLGLLTGK